MSALTLLAGLVAIVVFTWAVYVFARFITGYPSHRADAWERRELRGEKTVSQTVERESVADIVDEHRDVLRPSPTATTARPNWHRTSSPKRRPTIVDKTNTAIQNSVPGRLAEEWILFEECTDFGDGIGPLSGRTRRRRDYGTVLFGHHVRTFGRERLPAPHRCLSRAASSSSSAGIRAVRSGPVWIPKRPARGPQRERGRRPH